MHFSLSFGEGETLISDIQGSFSTLTDPQIHSTTKFLHNPNNGGQDYINKFNDEHECNSNCIAFNLAEELEQ
ncbi:hypothetical protein BC833DRAFT_612768 [Globomyces pollinis-pini]|nr:hypothetical protein BC833DRAFT_612768 [Globomyces pollinis-pini]